jgi:DNA repair exonuclease SbcCD ATPase subunit
VTRKQELIAAAERIDPAGDVEAARAQLRSIQERWEAVGKIPRERVKELEGRLRAVEDRVRTAANTQWKQIDPESEARVAQFRERVEQYEAQAAKARAAGDDRRASTAQAQADQWREWLAAAERAVTSR